METPSSTRRVTRSQASATSQKSKQEDAFSRSRNSVNPDRVSLLDITNDSPIVGLATGGLAQKTPSSLVVKNMVRTKETPGSGEALLRGQVKNLLQKVDEEAGIVDKLSLGSRPLVRALLGFPSSSVELLAPTPANTPQIPSLSVLQEEDVLMMPSVIEEDDPINPPQLLDAFKQEEPLGPCLINRALLFDSPGKSEMSDTSTISCQKSGSNYKEKSSDDDNSSAWSLQVIESIQEEDEEGTEVFEEKEEEEETDDYYEREDVDEEEENEVCYDDLCEGLSKMSVKDTVRLPEFTGKHTRFMYNSDDEIEGEEEVGEKCPVSPSVLLLKGLPIPEGKHLRFQEEEEEEG